MTWLVTGAGGFVGRELCAELQRRGFPYRGVLRRSAGVAGELVMAEQGENADWSGALAGVEALIHVAGRAHQMDDAATDPLIEYRKVNVGMTANLLRQAAQRGVRRFVYVSSLKVNGEATDGRGPYSEADTPVPLDAYGISKLEAEQAAQAIAAKEGIELCIVRPAMIYGPGMKGNLARIVRALWRGVPLPFGALYNQRSMVEVNNLCQALILCAQHPAAAGQMFLASDGDDVSTTELCRYLGQGLRRNARLLPVPAGMLRAAGKLAGKQEEIRRLCGSLQVDPSHILRTLPWRPVPTRQGLVATGAAWRSKLEQAA